MCTQVSLAASLTQHTVNNYTNSCVALGLSFLNCKMGDCCED